MRRPPGDSLPQSPRSRKRQRPDELAIALAITLALHLTVLSPRTAQAQLPEASYWRTRVFFIPYQPTDAAPFASPIEKVQLLVTRGGDNQWAVLQEAEPRVRGFSYHAPVDGEYAFAVRTVNRKGEATPATIAQPQIRVVVDTAPPTLQLSAAPDVSGRIILRYEARDLQLKPETVRLEAQSDGATWQRIATGPPDVSQPDRVVGQVAWKPPTSAGGVKFRATIDDRAGNQFSAIADASLVNPLTPTLAGPTLADPPTPQPFAGLAPSQPSLNGPALNAPTGNPFGSSGVDPFAASTPSLNPAANAAAPSPLFSPPAQEWTAAQSSPTPGAPTNALNSPPPAASPFAAANPPGGAVAPPLWPDNRTPARLVADNGAMSTAQLPSSDPFGAPPLVGANNSPTNNFTPNPFQPAASPVTPLGQQSIPNPPNWSAPANDPPVDAAGTRWVNSLTFDVDYDLQTVGPWGVSKVELFATRDGGASWVNFGADPDNRSPMRVAVPAAGLYGFRLVVNGANGAPAATPSAGDKPELEIGVDMTEPQAELQPAELGQGNLADHLIIRWSATDENLDARPVGLFYANNPEGPWSTVATDIDNNGQYAWRLLQQVPERLFLRLEVRDKAGNVAIRQSPAPVALNLPQPTGKLRSVRPVQAEPQRFRTASGQEIRNQ
jgi:hypothetical protein